MNITTDRSISTIDPVASWRYLCFEPENQYLERKGIAGAGLKPAKLADEIIGMLNADGGIIAVGIADDGTLQSLDSVSTELRRQYEKVVQTYIKPPANVVLEQIIGPNGELVFLYHVAEDYETLFSRSDKDKESVFRRVADSNFGPLNLDEINKLQHDKFLRRFEETTRKDFDPVDLKFETIEKYRKQLNFQGSHEELLIKRNVAYRKKEKDEVLYRNSAILLFAEDPEKYIASAFVRYVRYEGTTAQPGDAYNVTKDTRFYGNIPDVIDAVQQFVFASLDDYYYFDTSAGRFVSISEYPEDAWLEGIVNALFHRSYNLQGNSIYIKHFDDRLEISNSGPLPAQVTVDNIRRERFSRNPRIGRVLAEMGYVRELNEGVNRIYRSMEASMLAEPIYTDTNDTVTLTLRNKVASHEKSIPKPLINQIESEWSGYNQTQRQIVGYLFEHEHSRATVAELAHYVGISTTAVRSYLNGFIVAGILVRHSDKTRDKQAEYGFKKT